MTEEYNAYTGSRFSNFAEPTTQKKNKDAEIASTLAQLPVLQESIKRLDKRIAYFGSIDSIEVDLSKDPAMHRSVMAANRIIRDELARERTYILARIEKASER